MFKRLMRRIKEKEGELTTTKTKLKSSNIKERCQALMRLAPLKMEIMELKNYLHKKMHSLRKKEK